MRHNQGDATILIGRAAVPGAVDVRKIVPIFNRLLHPGACKEKDVSRPISIRTRPKSVHPLLQIEQVEYEMTCQVISDGYKAGSVPYIERSRIHARESRSPRKYQIQRAAEGRDAGSVAVRGVVGTDHFKHVL